MAHQPSTIIHPSAILFDFGNVIAFFDHMKACARLAGFSWEEMSPGEAYERVFVREFRVQSLEFREEGEEDQRPEEGFGFQVSGFREDKDDRRPKTKDQRPEEEFRVQSSEFGEEGEDQRLKIENQQPKTDDRVLKPETRNLKPSSSSLLLHTPTRPHAHTSSFSLEECYDRGLITTGQFLEALKETLHLEVSLEVIAQSWSDIFWPNEAVVRIIPRLAETYRLVLASNTNDLHCHWFREHFADTLQYFDAQVCSHEVGCRKPDQKFYECCLEAAQCPASECLYFDDKPELVEAARALGIQGIVYTPEVDVGKWLMVDG